MHQPDRTKAVAPHHLSRFGITVAHPWGGADGCLGGCRCFCVHVVHLAVSGISRRYVVLQSATFSACDPARTLC
jgi:hypothetical protein